MRGRDFAFGRLPWPVRLMILVVCWSATIHTMASGFTFMVTATLTAGGAEAGKQPAPKIMALVKANAGKVALLVEQQLDAIKQIYAGTLDMRGIATSYPSLSHHKQNILGTAGKLRDGLEGKALHRECCKLMKLPVPEGHYEDDEMRDAVTAYHCKGVLKVSNEWITDTYGPSKTTLNRQHKRLLAAMELAKLPKDAPQKQVRGVAAAIDFPKGGRPTYFNPDEERILFEMIALHADHGHGKVKRLQLNYAKRAVDHMAKELEDPEERERFSKAKLSHQWLCDARERVAKAGTTYKDTKPATLSQKRAAAKKPGQNAAMFAARQVYGRRTAAPPHRRTAASPHCRRATVYLASQCAHPPPLLFSLPLSLSPSGQVR